MIQTQEDGGLGFGGLKNKNLALLRRWGWRFFNEENSLRVQLVKSIHGKAKSVGTPKELFLATLAVRGLAFQGARNKWIRWYI